MGLFKYVRMLDTCEDTQMYNVQEDVFDEAVSGDYAPVKSIGKIWQSPETKDVLLAISRTDYLTEGQAYKLPKKQADHLIDLELAEPIE